MLDVSKDNHSHSEQTPPISKERKTNASNIELSQKNKKFNKNITGEGFRLLKLIMKFVAGVDHSKIEMFAELRRNKYHDLDDMVYRMELTEDEIMDVLDIKNTGPTAVGFTLAPGIHEISGIKSVLKSLNPDEVKVNITIDDIRLKSNLTTNKTKRYIKKPFHKP